ncbi:DUF3575 domain-containing protein [Polaribacter sp. WD7]|uniref:DUF3575 domain-containing protein n=1 Tax=Polaribacter sp. WD7 TaxID=2269061 RepID=UPI000DF49C20|nr:DUF3575 domain-containing protein [Polaribacter sp. WD7]RCS26307.1 DUF3575 domain-containing protein [Polaribacter sp. WD7]
MKKKLFLPVLLFSAILFAQEKQNKYPQDTGKTQEIKIDAFSLIVFSSFDVTYERLVNKDSSYGVSLFYNFNTIDSDLYFPKKFSLTPFYRWFFTETRFARGFFVEGFGMLNTFEEEVYSFDSFDTNGNFETVKETDFAIGISVGGKFIIKSGFVAEISIGVGRNIFGNTADGFLENELVTRGGISLGYRF